MISVLKDILNSITFGGEGIERRLKNPDFEADNGICLEPILINEVMQPKVSQ